MITIHSDDFGYKKYTDNKIIQLIKKGKLKSVSVIANMVDVRSLKKMFKAAENRGDINIGLHINLTEGLSFYDNKFIPSIVYKKNRFLGLPGLFLKLIFKMINENHIEREINKQIDFLQHNGINVSILDSHEHIHGLSPVSEIVEKIAHEREIKTIRSYKNVKNYTLIANIKYNILKLMGYITHFIYYGKLELPSSWNIANNFHYSYMSWEGHSFDFHAIKDKSLILVTHPFLPFDSNKSYLWLLV